MVLDGIFDWLLRWNNVISGLGSLLLSAALVYFYLRMKQTQQERTDIHRNQTDIQQNQVELAEHQRDIMEISHQPNIQVDAFGIRDDVRFSRIKVILSNIGKGHAYNLRIGIKPIIEDKDDLEVENTQHSLHESGDRDDNMKETKDNYVLPGRSEQEFYGSTSLHMERDPFNLDNPAIFEFATELLDEEGLDKLRLKLFIRYDGPLDEDQQHEFADIVVPIRGRTSLEIAMEHAISYDVYSRQSHVPRMSEWGEIEEDTGVGVI